MSKPKIKGKSLRRAMGAVDGYRISGDVPLIFDTTEFITPEIAEKMLRKNKKNRPINWNKVEEYRRKMEAGEWTFHAQGVVLDQKDNILTGQKRLWAIVYCGVGQYMRVSRGSPSNTAPYLDRGTPQSSRDLATRSTDRKHSPTEASIVRAICAIDGITRPSVDQIAEGLAEYSEILEQAMKATKGIKKTKAMLMVLAAGCSKNIVAVFGHLEGLSAALESSLRPTAVDNCWNRGAAFCLAMEKACEVVGKRGDLK